MYLKWIFTWLGTSPFLARNNIFSIFSNVILFFQLLLFIFSWCFGVWMSKRNFYLLGISLGALMVHKIWESWATSNWSKGSVGQEESRSQILSTRSSIPNTGFHTSWIPNSEFQIQVPRFQVQNSRKIWSKFFVRFK